MFKLLIPAFLVFAFLFPQSAMAAPSFYDACNTQAEYKKLVKYVRTIPSRSDRVVMYLREVINKKYKGLSRAERERHPDYKKDVAKALQQYHKPNTVEHPSFACQPLRGSKIFVEKSGAFSGYACVKAPSWKTCKWTSRDALRSKWSPSADKKIWHRK